MKILKGLGIALIVLFLAFAGYNATQDGHYEVSRTVKINASPMTVSAIVSEFRNWPDWAVWFQRDSTMVATFGEKTTGVGANYSWVSENSGAGRMEILAYEPGTSMNTSISFDGQGSSNGFWKFEQLDHGVTQVTWGMTGEMGFFGRFLAPKMEQWVGPDFEQGLDNLIALAERVQRERDDAVANERAVRAAIEAAMEPIQH